MGIQRLPTFTDYMYQRIYRKNQNLIILTVGGTGSGKSYSQIKEAEQYYKKAKKGMFPIKNICFTARNLMERINSGELRKGDALVYEEVGINQNSRNWYSIMNKMMNYLLQSFRNLNIILLMNTPDVTFLDSQTRKLVHFFFEPVGIDINKKICRIKPFQIQVNRKTGKVYMKYLRILVDGEVMPLKRINYKLPSKRLREAYEKKKRKYTQQLNKKILKEIIEAEKQELSKQELTESQEKVLNLFKDGKVIWEIAKELKCDKRSIYAHMNVLKKKGYKIRAKKDGNTVKRYEIS